MTPHKARKNQNENSTPEVRNPYFLLYVTKMIATAYKKNIKVLYIIVIRPPLFFPSSDIKKNYRRYLQR